MPSTDWRLVKGFLELLGISFKTTTVANRGGLRKVCLLPSLVMNGKLYLVCFEGDAWFGSMLTAREAVFTVM